jgi:hypothetical protein
MKNRSKSRRAVQHNGNSAAAEDRVIPTGVEYHGIADIIGPLLDLQWLFMLMFSSKELYKNYKPFVLDLLRRENPAVRLLRVCTRERHRRLNVDSSHAYCFDVCMDPEFDEDKRSEIFQTFDFATVINFNMSVPKRPRRFQDFEQGRDLTHYFQFTINSGPRDDTIELSVFDYRNLRRQIRTVHFESDADLPQWQGEGEDFTFRTRRELHLIPCVGPHRSHPIQQVVLTVNNREWIGAVTIFPDGSRQCVFKFRRNANGTAHVLILASDLIEHVCGFSAHAELGIARS